MRHRCVRISITARCGLSSEGEKKKKNELSSLLEGPPNDMDPKTSQKSITHPKSSPIKPFRSSGKSISIDTSKILIHRPAAGGLETNYIWWTTRKIHHLRHPNGKQSHPSSQLFQNSILHLFWRCDESIRPSPPTETSFFLGNKDPRSNSEKRTTKQNARVPLHNTHGRLFHHSHHHQRRSTGRPARTILLHYDIRRNAETRRSPHTSSTRIRLSHSSMASGTIPQARPGSSGIPSQAHLYRRQHSTRHLLLQT